MRESIAAKREPLEELLPAAWKVVETIEAEAPGELVWICLMDRGVQVQAMPSSVDQARAIRKRLGVHDIKKGANWYSEKPKATYTFDYDGVEVTLFGVPLACKPIKAVRHMAPTPAQDVEVTVGYDCGHGPRNLDGAPMTDEQIAAAGLAVGDSAANVEGE